MTDKTKRKSKERERERERENNFARRARTDPDERSGGRSTADELGVVGDDVDGDDDRMLAIDDDVDADDAADDAADVVVDVVVVAALGVADVNGASLAGGAGEARRTTSRITARSSMSDVSTLIRVVVDVSAAPRPCLIETK